ncbi:hypothetical protein KZZ10_05655 [Alcaligenaceae bacterium LF4-65]|uniref:Mannosyltransferase n=1 Tax=Zwartia hollandica TaxID=324606 RepID=A0A953N8H5_9BURK|nr:hypothetical protein [Zwartia hollandica]MBZ1350124.1 hypothetical protein [Zwartia hollandica]
MQHRASSIFDRTDPVANKPTNREKIPTNVDFKYQLAVMLVIFTSSALSIWQGLFSVDPHHWGLMVSNAKELLDGLHPNHDVGLFYGVLTPLLQGTVFNLTSQSIISIQATTVALYGLGLFLLFRLAYTTTQDSKLSFYILCSCVLVHPIVIYPWPNYVAFPFLIGGIWLSILDAPNKFDCFTGGLLLSFGTLARTEYIPLAVFILFLSPTVDLFIKRASWLNVFTRLFCSFLGLVIPLCGFAFYLIRNGLVGYWVDNAFTLPMLVTPKLFAHMHGFSIFDSFIRIGIWGASQFNLRLIIIYLMILLNIIYCLAYIIKRFRLDSHPSLFKVSLISLLLVGQLLHLPEIFRMATGSIIGLITFYTLLKKIKLAGGFFFTTSFFWIFISPPITVDSGNYFFPTRQTISVAKFVHDPVIFKYQLWPEPVSDYYSKVSKDMTAIKELNCGVTYHFNYSIDVFLHVISPFRKYQVLPFDNPLMHPAFKIIRPELLPIEEKQKDLDVMIMRLIPNEEVDAFTAPMGYFIYKKYLTPSMVFVPVNHTLMLMVPETCRVK